MYDTAAPYIASYIVMRNDAGEIAFVLRANTSWMNGFYGLPSGKVEKHESFTEACAREAKEEIGIIVLPEDLTFLHVMHRHTQSENSEWVDVFFEAEKYEGEIYNAEPEVHSELAWLDPKNLPENVIPSVKFAIERIDSGYTFSEFGFKD